MIFNNLVDVLTFIRILENANTSIRITDIGGDNIFYESLTHSSTDIIKRDNGRMLPYTYTACSADTSFSVSVYDDFITLVTTMPVLIGNTSHLLELKQITKRNGWNPERPDVPEDISLHRMKEIAVTDSLTKLYNRRYIDERLPIDMQSSFEFDEPLSVLFLDIDYFKDINDKNGHIAGDQVLQDISAMLQKQLRRGSGWIARYGGDEILICLPGSGEKIAKGIANRIRKDIEKHIFRIGDKEIKVTCSLGVQTVSRDSGVTSVPELMSLADKNLYRAKKEGRNRVF